MAHERDDTERNDLEPGDAEPSYAERDVILGTGGVAIELWDADTPAYRARVRTLIRNGTIAAVPARRGDGIRYLVPSSEVRRLRQEAETNRRDISAAHHAATEAEASARKARAAARRAGRATGA